MCIIFVSLSAVKFLQSSCVYYGSQTLLYVCAETEFYNNKKEMSELLLLGLYGERERAHTLGYKKSAFGEGKITRRFSFPAFEKMQQK